MGRYQFLITPHWLIRCYAYQIDSADGKGLPTGYLRIMQNRELTIAIEQPSIIEKLIPFISNEAIKGMALATAHANAMPLQNNVCFILLWIINTSLQ